MVKSGNTDWFPEHRISTRYSYVHLRVMKHGGQDKHYSTTWHYNVVIMGSMASQVTSLTIVYSTVYSRCSSKKASKLRVTGLCAGNSPVTGEFPGQRTSNAENVSIWWRHHEKKQTTSNTWHDHMFQITHWLNDVINTSIMECISRIYRGKFDKVTGYSSNYFGGRMPNIGNTICNVWYKVKSSCI